MLAIKQKAAASTTAQIAKQRNESYRNSACASRAKSQIGMNRVSKNNPCPVCDKPDWCLVAPDGSAAICARISEGSIKKCADAGYLHILVDRPKNRQCRSQRRFSVKLSNGLDRDFAALQQKYSCQITNQQLNDLSQQLGVSAQSLKRLRIGWDGKAFAFPMSDSHGRTIGIRRRFPNGPKVSVKGSKTGLFIPTDLPAERLLLICEGASDTAAALDLGFDAVGRPNCNSCVEMAVDIARGRTEIVIIGDNDKAGKSGAEKLANTFVLHYPSVKIIYPPAEIKDLRQWLQKGLIHTSLQRIIDTKEAIEVKVSFKD